MSITGLKMVENLVLYYPDKDERLKWGELIVVRDSADYAWLAEASVNDTCMDCFFPWLPLGYGRLARGSHGAQLLGIQLPEGGR